MGVSSDTSAYDGSTLELVRKTLPAIMDAVREIIYSLRDDDATAAEDAMDGDNRAWPSLIEKAEEVDTMAARNSIVVTSAMMMTIYPVDE